mgnify:CR=1 FL=1
MNAIERIKMVKAMEYIARKVNDEEIFELWLTEGVADDDIELGDLAVQPEDFSNLGVYIENESFSDLMHTFLLLMSQAYRSGGLVCDGIVDGKQ